MLFNKKSNQCNYVFLLHNVVYYYYADKSDP